MSLNLTCAECGTSLVRIPATEILTIAETHDQTHQVITRAWHKACYRVYAARELNDWWARATHIDLPPSP